MSKKIKKTFIKDYTPSIFSISKIDLDIVIKKQHTLVKSKLFVKKKIKTLFKQNLVLDGENLECLSLSLNETSLRKKQYIKKDSHLIIKNPPDAFTLESTVRLYPQNNKSLEGLYLARNILCTQNEAEGFRKITFFIDRPDNLAIFSTRITANKDQYPVILSNGNLENFGENKDKTHWAIWKDPLPKPSYLYALVAGDLLFYQDYYETKSKKKVNIKIYTTKGETHKCHHAASSLKKAMKWDEEVYGLEYDLKHYNIVAIESFNSGAMENKGLNIFNANLILVSPDTTTDAEYVRIENIVAHEYFHNWTGNRITIRDWFQLTLKEGLTVFRDQCFTASFHSKTVKRIQDAIVIKQNQFTEDLSNHAHSIQPSEYLEIRNFYTTTVYEKGAAVIRMLFTLLTKDVFYRGIKKYLIKYDGKASTIEDFLHSMQSVSKIKLKQFKRWYHQKGTPILTINKEYSKKKEQFILEIHQSIKKHKLEKPLLFPLKISLFTSKKTIFSSLILFNKRKKKMIFKNISQKPFLSINEDFICPVIIKESNHLKDLLQKYPFEKNLFNQWELTMNIVDRLFLNYSKDNKIKVPKTFNETLLQIAQNPKFDPDYKSECFTFPSPLHYLNKQQVIDIKKIHSFCKKFDFAFANLNKDFFLENYKKYAKKSFEELTYQERAWKNRLLYFLVILKKQEYFDLVYKQFQDAKTMNTRLINFSYLVFYTPYHEKAIKIFEKKYQNDSLVMNKYFSIQARIEEPSIFKRLSSLENHPSFDIYSPNKLMALYKNFSQFNLLYFNHPSGKGYEFLAKKIIKIDVYNPQIAARIASSFNYFKNLPSSIKEKMEKAMLRIQSQPISKDLNEIISNILK